MILSPVKNEKFDKAKTFQDKAKITFGKDIGEAIGLGYQKFIDENNISKYNFKDITLVEFSKCKQLYDKFLSNCDVFHDKDLNDKSEVYFNFLKQRTPEIWVQHECGYNNYDNIEDEEVTIDEKTYNINDIDILTQHQTIQSVYKKYLYEEINLNPDFQRNEIWTLKQKSLLIESILINIPIPAFYIDARIAGKLVVIDGLQRLSTIMKFIGDEIVLVDTQYLKLKGKKFSTIERKYQRRIEDYQLTFNLIRSGTPPEVAFNIFSRINTLGTTLSAQEIRHAMNMGTSTDFLKELSLTEEFKKAISHKQHKSLSKRMNDKALILRYLSFKLLGYDEKSYSKNDMDAFLISGMKYLNNLDENKEEDKRILNEIKQDFIQSMTKAHIIFKDRTFRKFFTEEIEDKKAPINIPLFETISQTLEKYSIEEIEQNKTQLFDEFLFLFIERETDENSTTGRFIDWITNATNNPDHVRKRFGKVNEVFEKIIGH